MPAAVAAAVAPSLLIFDDGDDDGFGDFKFAPSAAPVPAEGDDEWGDFVASPSSAPAPPPPGPGRKEWERPRGALPLSLFGDDEAAEAEPEPEAPVFTNGFASQKPAKELKGDLKDLIVNMYGPAVAVATTVNRNGVYEKKPGYANGNGIEKEGNGLEKEAVYANGNEMTIVGNRMGDSQEAVDQHRVGRVSEDLFESNDFKFGSVIGYENYITQTNLQIGYNDRGNVPQSTLQNGDESDDDSWEFKCAFSEVGDAASSPGPQGIGNLWESNLGDLSVPYESNRKNDQGELFVDHNGPSYDPTYAGTGTKAIPSGGGIVFSDIFANLYDKADQIYNVQSIKNSLEDGPKSAEFDPNSLDVRDDSEFNEMQWEFQKTSGTKFTDQDSALRLDQNVSVESVQNTFLDIYRRLREESLFLIVRHLNDLKVANITGEQAKVTEINEIIQEAYKKIQETSVSEDDYIERHQSRDACVSQLLDVIKEPHFQAMEQEYCLHDRILLAGKDVKAAIELFEHTISILQILGSASKEEINAYVNAWSRMALGCLEELQHGAMIWAESLRANICTQILSQGYQYFIALGEVYRVTEVLRASSRLYKPWLLSSQGDYSEVLLTCLEKCAQVWTVSGLEKALESISSARTLEFEGILKPLLESIKLIRDLDQASTQHAFGPEETLCNLSLLPMGLLQGMGAIVWDGGHYYTKLANLWANRISCDPPKLPHISVKWD